MGYDQYPDYESGRKRVYSIEEAIDELKGRKPGSGVILYLEESTDISNGIKSSLEGAGIKNIEIRSIKLMPGGIEKRKYIIDITNPNPPKAGIKIGIRMM